MSYIAPIHRPSTVQHALCINLLAEDEPNLVLAKTNRLEIWRVTDGMLSLVHSTSIFGTVSMLQKLRPKDSPTDLLFVGTARFHYFTARWNPRTEKLELNQHIHDTGEKHMRDSQSQDRCLVDPTGKFMAMHLWEGVLNVMRLLTRGNKSLTLECLDQVRLKELFIKASTFLHTETGIPKVAFLYHLRAHSTDSKIVIYKLTGDDRNTTSSRFDWERDRELYMDFDDGVGTMIPVRQVEEEVKRHNVRNPDPTKAQLGGLLVVGEISLLYIDEVTKAKVEGKLKEPCIFVAWAEYDPTHYFLADDFGTMHLLTIITDGAVVTRMDVSKIGSTSRASCLTYLGNNLLFVGSHYADSQLFHVDFQSENFQYLTVVQKFPNISPILDFSVMDMGNREGESQLGNAYSSGQARIVTGSGVYKDGRLISVRSGVGLEDIGILGDLEHSRGLFSFKSHDSEHVNMLLVSFLTETRIFRFDPAGEVEELESFAGLALDTHTILAADVPRGRILQVTSTAATLVELEGGIAVASWSPARGKSITNASANGQSLLLAIDGTALVSLSIANDLSVVAQRDISAADQVACIHVAPGLENTGVVGFWSSATVSIIDLTTLQPIHGESMRRTEDSASVPRDLALVQVLPPSISGPTLFVSMEDGNVVTFNVSQDMSLSGRKSVVLGTQQARLHLLPKKDGIYNIFATSIHPSLIYGSEGRIVFSSVTADEAEYVCPFDRPEFPDGLVVATNSQVKISQIDNERRTHVRPLAMGKSIRRIAYSSKEKVFGLGCVKRTLVQGEEVHQCSFELVDEVIFEKLGKPFLLEKVSHLEMVEDVIRAELPDAYGHMNERFIVGTSFQPSSDSAIVSAIRGRILVFGVDRSRNPFLVVSHNMKGSCRRLAVLDKNKIVVALSKTVVVTEYNETSDISGELTRLASYRPSTYPVDITVHGNLIAVVDLMKSISLLELVPGSGTAEHQLVERARDYQSVWGTAASHIEGDSWLEADAQGNLIVLKRNTEGVTDEDKKRLELTSEISLGEAVNKICKIEVETSPNAMIVPRAFLGTVEGGIYMYGTVAAHAQDLLMRFQSRLETVVKPLGGISFKEYRSFRNPEREGEGPYRFLDGDLLERFLDADEEMQSEICQGLGPSVEDMRNIIEELKRMH